MKEIGVDGDFIIMYILKAIFYLLKGDYTPFLNPCWAGSVSWEMLPETLNPKALALNPKPLTLNSSFPLYFPLSQYYPYD